MVNIVLLIIRTFVLVNAYEIHGMYWNLDIHVHCSDLKSLKSQQAVAEYDNDITYTDFHEIAIATAAAGVRG